MKTIEVRGHYKRVVIGYKIVKDASRPGNETEIAVYKTIWVAPYKYQVKDA